MKLTITTLDRLRSILREDFGLEVNDKELHAIAFNLIGYFNALLEYDREDKAPKPAPATQTTL
ncbi:MAG TPA: hypothetical protein VNK70_03160 [Candidatus Paceibacterota bacterium]|nr:hypothetical protein [Candidatus Paceibacterota bacterium]